jgi:hypothetical protein
MKLSILSVAAVAAFGLAACQPAAETETTGTAGDMSSTMPSPSTSDTSAMNPTTGQMGSETMPGGSTGTTPGMTPGGTMTPGTAAGATNAPGASGGTASPAAGMGSTGSSTPPA